MSNFRRGLSALVLLVAITLYLEPVALAAEIASLGPGSFGVTGDALKPFQARYAETSSAGGPGRSRIVHLQQAQYPGGEGLRLVITMLGQSGTVYDEIQFLREDLAPVMRSISALSMLHQIEVFENGSIRGQRIAPDGSQAEALRVEVKGSRFWGGMTAMALASQDLAKGFKARLQVFSMDMGPDAANAITEVEVVRAEKLEAAGQAFDTWVTEIRLLDVAGNPLELPNGSPFPTITEWITQRPPYSIRTQFGSAQTVELVSVDWVHDRTAAP